MIKPGPVSTTLVTNTARAGVGPLVKAHVNSLRPMACFMRSWDS
ncbi:hypothetical protein J2X68_007986 [Streptomyces sp. 3330]|nr:hypothetical protein [Streptomyces sp. 3330]